MAQPSHPQEQLPGAAGASGRGATVCLLQGSPWAVVFVNWETFPLSTGNSLSCALGISFFFEGTEGLFFFYQEE